jgi:hypothetical protein
MSTRTDILDEMLSEIDPGLIPSEFILAAKVFTNDGRELVLNGAEFASLIDTNPDIVRDYRVLLNVKLAKAAVTMATIQIFEEARLS